MYDTERKYRSRGLTAPWVVTIIFCVLKFVGLIDWPWYWLISPIWICVAISMVLLGMVLIFCHCDKKYNKK